MRKFEQRSIVLFALGVLGAFGVPGHSVAQDTDLTSGNMAIVVHTGAGGSLDTLARTAAELLTRNEGWSVRVENRQGGNGAVALAHLMSQPADGRTLLGVTKALSNNFALERAPAEFGGRGRLGVGEGGRHHLPQGNHPIATEHGRDAVALGLPQTMGQKNSRDRQVLPLSIAAG